MEAIKILSGVTVIAMTEPNFKETAPFGSEHFYLYFICILKKIFSHLRRKASHWMTTIADT